MDKIQKMFEDSKKEILVGNLKFSSDYVSYFELFRAVSKWIEADKNVLSATVRGGGGQVALDFKYDLSKVSKKEADSSLHTIIKPAFKELLGDDYLVGWDYSTSGIVVK